MSDDMKKYLPTEETMRRVMDRAASEENRRRALEGAQRAEARFRAAEQATAMAVPKAGEAGSSRAWWTKRRMAIAAAAAALAPAVLVYALMARQGERRAEGANVEAPAMNAAALTDAATIDAGVGVSIATDAATPVLAPASTGPPQPSPPRIERGGVGSSAPVAPERTAPVRPPPVAPSGAKTIESSPPAVPMPPPAVTDDSPRSVPKPPPAGGKPEF